MWERWWNPVRRKPVFRAPHHPYTQALVSAIPEIDPASRTMKIHLEGEPRSPINIGRDFCRFAGRCPRTAARCSQESPRPCG
ncbi:MAG: oligopeptide/dipeptide ABC transporter ATP-binding protein [Pseudomonadota bacterium]